MFRMRYRLRTLTILTALLPPFLAGAWFVGRSAIDAYRVRDIEWIEVGGPGTIIIFESSTSCTFEDVVDIDDGSKQNP